MRKLRELEGGDTDLGKVEKKKVKKESKKNGTKKKTTKAKKPLRKKSTIGGTGRITAKTWDDWLINSIIFLFLIKWN